MDHTAGPAKNRDLEALNLFVIGADACEVKLVRLVIVITSNDLAIESVNTGGWVRTNLLRLKCRWEGSEQKTMI